MGKRFQIPGCNRRGFTLVELVVSIVVGSIISGIAAVLIMSAAKQRAEVSARSELIDQGSAAMECILRYVREISQDECPSAGTPCLNGNAQVSTASATDLRFDIYGIRLSSGEIQITRDTGTTWNTLAKGVTGLTFTYFDRTSTTLAPLPLSATNREDIRRILIQIDMSSGGEAVRLRTSIFLRNFMNEVMNAP
ncbi:MAG: type II secretion system protein [Planctomycetes bacterium]|nr:type II secretion system protein [Planctomycetota bacterium]